MVSRNCYFGVSTAIHAAGQTFVHYGRVGVTIGENIFGFFNMVATNVFNEE